MLAAWADQLAREGAHLDAIRHHAQVASLNAQIATQRMLTHDAREEIDRASAGRTLDKIADVRSRSLASSAVSALMQMYLSGTERLSVEL